MPTINPRITFTVSEEMLKRIDAYRFDNRIKNQTQAIVSLIDIGLASLNNGGKEPLDYSITDEEMHVVEAYRYADKKIRDAALNMLESYPEQKKHKLYG